MSQVFISYRQTDDEQCRRVRAFAERLRSAGIDVILDQFFLEDNPGGPDEGWPKWSSDRALKTDYVLIVGTAEWYQCFEGTQPPGTYLGAACEASDIRTRIYKAASVINNIRVVLLADGDDENIPDKLSPYHRFHAVRDFPNITRWLRGRPYAVRKTNDNRSCAIPVSPGATKRAKLRKENNPFQTAGALPYDHRTYIRRVSDDVFEHCLRDSKRLISINGEFGIGKSSLTQQARRLLPDHHFFGGALADLGGHDAGLFMKKFFKLFAKHFGPISEWDELDECVSRCPSVLLLDDVGEVAAAGLGALVPALIARMSKQEAKLRVIATSSQPLQTIFAARELDNPKYSKPWTRITVETCTDVGVRELLQILPRRSQAVAMGHFSIIQRISRGAPQALQTLCYHLFDGECDGFSNKQLSTLIENYASYE